MSALSRIVEGAGVAGPRLVTSASPLASAAGVQAYALGGNAFDAALAACFMEMIVLPMKCGLAGDLVALVRRAGGPLEAIVSVGPGCAAIARGEHLEKLGPRSVGIPGAPAAYAHLAASAALPLDMLIRPAVRAAHEGTPWTRVGLSYVHEARDLLLRWNDATPYMPGGQVPEVGDLLRLPGLGALLERFAEQKADLFRGADGDRLVASVKSRGGILSRDDLESSPLEILEPIAAAVGSDRLIATPAPTGGPRLLDLMTRTLDPETDPVAVVRAERIEARLRGRQTVQDGTSVVTATDAQGNAVVVVHSNSFPRFGSGLVLDDGLVLNNRPGRGFDLQARSEADNAPRAGRVPATTLHAWALEQQDRLCLGATPGGVNQLPWNLQTLRDLRNGLSAAEAVARPRWALDEQDRLTAEIGALPDDVDAQTIAPLSLRSAQQILSIGRHGRAEAAADPRVVAAAMAAY